MRRWHVKKVHIVLVRYINALVNVHLSVNADMPVQHTTAACAVAMWADGDGGIKGESGEGIEVDCD